MDHLQHRSGTCELGQCLSFGNVTALVFQRLFGALLGFEGRGFKGIISGEFDALPEQAFYMVGSIEEAVAKAKTLQ